ncbi:glycosyltransferase family 2 protein [Arcticibacter sp.]|uniref:glycosyltransferase family 2 protein n=1 Tax=Arcticibacter sp. TaxID=1872630 RepID=UPI00388E9FE6
MTGKIDPGVSLIVSTYNWPEALNLCLISISKQCVLPNEVIIADDGSTEETRKLVQEHQLNFPVPLIHVWQADDGFQLAKIRNKAIARASKEYIVQIDGDLILDYHFIQDHVAFSRQSAFVSGTRVQMSSALSRKVLDNKATRVSMLSKGIINFFNGFRIPVLRHFLAARYKSKDPAYVRGCNMAFWKADLINVNGFNESIVGWGREDSELAVRLMNSGVKKRILKFGAIAFHIYHKEVSRAKLAHNEELLTNAIQNNVKTCTAGLSQHIIAYKPK